MRTPTTLLAAAFVLSGLVPSTASAANTPSLASIPEVQFPEMLHPKDSPDSLPATEGFNGIVVNHVKQREYGNVQATEGQCLTMGAIAPGAVPSGNSNATIRASSSALPMRVEWFRGPDLGKPELVVTDAWVDMTSGGIQEVRSTHIPLTVIGSGAAGYSVYGFRSEGKLHAVFPTPQRFVAVDAFGKLGFVGCQHVRLVLDPAASNGSLIRVAGMIESRRSGPKGFISKLREKAQPMTLRAMEASVSVSKTKRDREPLLSVTVAWSEDEPPMPAVENAQPQVMPIEGPMPEPARIDEE